MLEVGNWVHADQGTGRILHVPNGFVFKNTVANYDEAFGYIWNELEVTVTFESDWRKAKATLEEILAAGRRRSTARSGSASTRPPIRSTSVSRSSRRLSGPPWSIAACASRCATSASLARGEARRPRSGSRSSTRVRRAPERRLRVPDDPPVRSTSPKASPMPARSAFGRRACRSATEAWRRQEISGHVSTAPGDAPTCARTTRRGLPAEPASSLSRSLPRAPTSGGEDHLIRSRRRLAAPPAIRGSVRDERGAAAALQSRFTRGDYATTVSRSPRRPLPLAASGLCPRESAGGSFGEFLRCRPARRPPVVDFRGNKLYADRPSEHRRGGRHRRRLAQGSAAALRGRDHPPARGVALSRAASATSGIAPSPASRCRTAVISPAIARGSTGTRSRSSEPARATQG